MAPPLILVEDRWGPFFDGLSVNAVARDDRPNIINLGDGPTVIGGCRISPELPAGLLFAASGNTCVMVGMPDIDDSSALLWEEREYTVTLSNIAGSQSRDVIFAFQKSPPVFGAISDAIVYEGFLEVPNATGERIDSCRLAAASPPLPSGVSLGAQVTVNGNETSGNSCVLHGAPQSSVEGGANSYTFEASNAIGATDFELDIEFLSLAPSLALPSFARTSLAVGLPVSLLMINGGSTVSSCDVNPALPPGLALRRNAASGSCRISGRPTAATAAADYTITASNSTGEDIAVLTLEVLESVAYPGFVEIGHLAEEAITGCRLAADSSPLPDGVALAIEGNHGTLEFSGDRCYVFGAPAIEDSLEGQLIEVETQTATASSTASFMIDFAALPPNIGLPEGTSGNLAVGAPVNITLDNIGSPVTSCTASPALPAGLEVEVSGDSSTCRIGGVPTAVSGGARYTITAANSAGSVSGTLELAVLESLAHDGFTEFVHPGGEDFSACALAAGSARLPMGVEISGQASFGQRESKSGACLIHGAPANDQDSEAKSYVIEATTAAGATSYEVQIAFPALAPMLAIPAEAPASLSAGQPASILLENIGSPVTSCMAQPELPRGLSVAPDAASGSCLISGTPSSAAAQNNYTIIAKNPLTGYIAVPLLIE